jgi:ubiquitin C-terminal hydrolase
MKLIKGLKSLFNTTSSDPTVLPSEHGRDLKPDSSDFQTTERSPIIQISASKSDLQARIKAADTLDLRRRTERAEVKRLLETGPEDGELVFFDCLWLDSWNDFLKGSTPPGPISFQGLLNEKGELRSGLLLDADYKAISYEIWSYLEQHHGSAPPLLGSSPDIYNGLFLADTCPTINPIPGNDFPAFARLRVSPEADEPDKPDSESRTSEAATTNLYTTIGSPQIRVTRGLVGLANPSLFCYMNASLQLLLSIEPFRDFFYTQHYREVANNRKKPVSEALADVVFAIFNAEAGYVQPTRLWSLYQRRFPHHKMHDAQEFLHFLLDSLDTELGLKTVKPGHAKSDLISSVFTGVLRSRILCLKCERTSDVYEQFLELSLPLAKSVKAALKLFYAKETLTEAYDCEKCRRRTDMAKEMSVDTWPTFLILSVKRFKQFPKPQKSSVFIKFRKRLSFPSAVEDVGYSLYSVIEHQGKDLESGHYVAYCRRGHTWFLFDDRVCTQVSLKDVLATQAFVMLYKRV